MTSLDDYADALQPLRLTPRQARFVVTIALNGGYFLRRHYMAYAGLRYGKMVREFPEQLVARGLATRAAGRSDRGFLYHLRARSIYRALGQEDNRNRRAASPDSIVRKLMLLDFVIGRPSVTWLATEADKVSYFADRLGLPRGDFPQQYATSGAIETLSTLRFFPDKRPIGIVGDPPAVHLVTLALDTDGAGFERFWLDHARLLSHLRSWTINVVGEAGSTRALSACRTLFERHTGTTNTGAGIVSDDQAKYFAIRRAIELNELARVPVADLHWYRDKQTVMSTPVVEAAYAQWRQRRSRAGVASLAPPSVTVERRGQLELHELPFTYEHLLSVPLSV